MEKLIARKRASIVKITATLFYIYIYIYIYILLSYNYFNISEISMCPSSIAAWFYARNYNVCRCCQKFFQKIKYSLTIPTYEDTCNNTDIDFFEWLGIFSIDGDLYAHLHFKMVFHD